MAESILKLFEKDPPHRVVVAAKGASLDHYKKYGLKGLSWTVFAINEAVHAIPCHYWVWQESSKYGSIEPPDGVIPIRPAGRSIVARGRGYEWDWEIANIFGWLNRSPKLALGALGEWTTGRALAYVGEWLRRHKSVAEVVIIGCEAYDNPHWPKGPEYAECVKPFVLDNRSTVPTDYSKSVEMLGLCLQQYADYFRPLRWLHREIKEAVPA